MYTRYRDTLANGLRVLTIEVPHLHAAMVAAYVHAGSRHERPEVNGVSHFLEHLFFRGCEAYPESLALNSAVERVGGSFNGVTTREHGCYFTTVGAEGLETALQVAGAMLTAPLMKEIELEREVILEEILDEVDAKGRLIDIDTLTKRIVFEGHPLSFPVGGDGESVARIQTADLWEHHRRFYCARNMVLTVAGPIKREAVLSGVERAFGALPAGEPTLDVAPPPYPAGPVVQFVSHRESQTELRLTFPGVPEGHPDFGALIVLRRILDDGLASRLQQIVVERLGLAYAVSASVDLYADLGLFEIDAASAHAKIPDLAAALLDVLRELRDSPPSQDELDRVRVRHHFGLDTIQDSVGDLAGWFGEGELLRHPVDLDARRAEIDAVRPEDVQRVAQAIFRRRNMIAVLVGLPDRTRTRRALERAALPD